MASSPSAHSKNYEAVPETFFIEENKISVVNKEDSFRSGALYNEELQRRNGRIFCMNITFGIFVCFNVIFSLGNFYFTWRI